MACNICGNKNHKWCSSYNGYLCDKHRRQWNKNKCFGRTKNDLNGYYIDDDVVYMNLYNKKQHVSGVAIFDLDDLPKIKNIKWYLNQNGYIRNTDHGYMHQIIMGSKDGYNIDHKDRNPLNNKKNNLRFVTHTDNIYNIPTPSNNTSGVVGVSWRKDRNKWRAHIKVGKKYVHLGHYDEFDDAVIARKEAEQKYINIEISPR